MSKPHSSSLASPTVAVSAAVQGNMVRDSWLPWMWYCGVHVSTEAAMHGRYVAAACQPLQACTETVCPT